MVKNKRTVTNNALDLSLFWNSLWSRCWQEIIHQGVLVGGVPPMWPRCSFWVFGVVFGKAWEFFTIKKTHLSLMLLISVPIPTTSWFLWWGYNSLQPLLLWQVLEWSFHWR